MCRYGALVTFAGILIASRVFAGPNDWIDHWYPFQPGDAWVYQEESLDGAMAHPNIDRSIVEETIVSAEDTPEIAATIVTKRSTVRSGAPHAPSATHLLIYNKCVYLLDGPVVDRGTDIPALDNAGHLRAAYRTELLHGNVPADLCFPMGNGATWGQLPDTSPAGEFVWNVIGVNADPFGPAGLTTFHLRAHIASGLNTDRWFTEGIGVVQEIEEHHGTYEEFRQRLLSSTINGKTRTYELAPARTAALNQWDCRGPGWQHYARPDGTLFQSLADCMAFFH